MKGDAPRIRQVLGILLLLTDETEKQLEEEC